MLTKNHELVMKSFVNLDELMTNCLRKSDENVEKQIEQCEILKFEVARRILECVDLVKRIPPSIWSL